MFDPTSMTPSRMVPKRTARRVTAVTEHPGETPLTTPRTWVEFDDPDGAKKRWNIPARTMTGDFGKDVLGPLVDMGLRLAGSRSDRSQVIQIIPSFFSRFPSGRK